MKKILSIIFCMLLIGTSLAIQGTAINTQEKTNINNQPGTFSDKEMKNQNENYGKNSGITEKTEMLPSIVIENSLLKKYSGDLTVLTYENHEIDGCFENSGPLFVPPETVYVDDDFNESTPGWGFDHFDTIQAGVNAVAEAGTVNVFNGIYTENIIIDKTLSLLGEGAYATIIEGNDSGTFSGAVSIYANGVRVSGFTIQHGSNGIFVDAASDTLIYDNYLLENSLCGVLLLNYDMNRTEPCNNVVCQNGFSENLIGIYQIGYMVNTTVSGNTVQNETTGIALEGAIGSTISSNTVESCSEYGIYLYGSDTGVFENYVVNTQLGGLMLVESVNTVVMWNTFSGTGIRFNAYTLPGWNTQVIENNVVDGRPIRYYKDSSDVQVPQNTGEVILANCQRFTIQNLVLTGIEDGIELAYSSDNQIFNNHIDTRNRAISLYNSSGNLMHDNILENAYVAIDLRGSSGNSIVLNQCFNNEQAGVSLRYSSSNQVTNNVMGQHNYGIVIDGSNVNVVSGNFIQNSSYDGIDVSASSQNTIQGNTIETSAECGISLYKSSDNHVVGNHVVASIFGGIFVRYSNNNLIEKNTMESDETGMRIQESTSNIISKNIISGSSFTGILLMKTAAYNTFIGNLIENTDGSGMWLDDHADNNTIIENTFRGSTRQGMYVTDESYGNAIYHNNFIDNNFENAVDECGNNMWDNGYPSGGNYWDDYIGTDANNDGIGDTPYYLYSFGEDRYPLMHSFKRGDMNVDGNVNFGDINPFVMALCNPTVYQSTFHILPVIHGDINQDGALNFGDIGPFVRLLSGGG